MVTGDWVTATTGSQNIAFGSNYTDNNVCIGYSAGTAMTTAGWSDWKMVYGSHQERLFYRVNEEGYEVREPLDELRLKVAQWLG